MVIYPQLTDQRPQMQKSAFIALKRVWGGGWEFVRDLDSDFQDVVAGDEFFDWLYTWAPSNQSKCISLQIRNEFFLIIKPY